MKWSNDQPHSSKQSNEDQTMSKWINTIAIAGMIATILACTGTEAASVPIPTPVPEPTRDLRCDYECQKARDREQATYGMPVDTPTPVPATVVPPKVVTMMCPAVKIQSWSSLAVPKPERWEGQSLSDDDINVGTSLCARFAFDQIGVQQVDERCPWCARLYLSSKWDGSGCTIWKPESRVRYKLMPYDTPRYKWELSTLTTFQNNCSHKEAVGSYEDEVRKPYQELACPVVEAAIEAKEAAIEDAWEAFSAGTTSYESYKLEESRKANYTVWVMNASEGELRPLVDLGLAKYIYRHHSNAFDQGSQSCSKDLESLECLRDIISIALIQAAPEGDSPDRACERRRQN